MDQQSSRDVFEALKNLVQACEENGLQDLPKVQEARRIVETEGNHEENYCWVVLKETFSDPFRVRSVDQVFFDEAKARTYAKDAFDGNWCVSSYSPSYIVQGPFSVSCDKSPKAAMEIVWVQNLKALVKNGDFRSDERWKAIFVEQLDLVSAAELSQRS
jgi:hypothetical protein